MENSDDRDVTTKPADMESTPDEMIAISVNQLMVGSISPTDIYLKLPSGKMLMLIKSGGKLNLSELHATSTNQVDHLYVLKDEFNKLLGMNLQIAGVAISRAELSEAQKLTMLASSADGVFREIESIGFNQLSCTHAKFVTKSLITLIETKTDLQHLISSMDKISGEVVKHCLSVSAISVMIAEAQGWTAPQRLERIALGAFLHDIGLREVPEEIVDKPRHLLTLDEVKTYEEHVVRGAEILKSIPEIPDDVIAIALQHHENAVGTGYPNRLKDIRMNPYAKVVSLADAYSELVFKSKNNPKPRSAEEALNFIEASLGQPFNKQAFAALKSCVQGEAPKVGKVKVLG